MSSRIRVLIVDDQTLVREGFRKLLELEPDFEVIDTASDGEAAVSATERLYAAGTPPDVLLMDIRMPRMDGIAATHAIKARWPDAHIVILTTFDEVELISAGLHAGALGYLLKTSPRNSLPPPFALLLAVRSCYKPRSRTKYFQPYPLPHRQRQLHPLQQCQICLSRLPNASAKFWRWSPKEHQTARSAKRCSLLKAPSKITSAIFWENWG